MAEDEEDSKIPKPRENDYFVGQAAAEHAFLKSWASGRLHHAWLLSGPRGVGKATLAYRIARFVLSGGPPGLFGAAEIGLDVPSEALIFRQVRSGGHPDFLTIERTADEDTKRVRSVIIVDHVRQISEFLHLKAAHGGWRVVIVDEAERMNQNAAGALLKILEEPPQRALLLLTSHVPGRLLATIRSRCRQIALATLNERTVSDLLDRYAADQNAADRMLLAKISGGSIGRALDMAVGGGVEVYKELTTQLRTWRKIRASDETSRVASAAPKRLGGAPPLRTKRAMR